jgi:hypothetical protein
VPRASNRSSRALSVSTSFFVANPIASNWRTTFCLISRTRELPASCHQSLTAEVTELICSETLSRRGALREEFGKRCEESASRPARTYFCMASSISARIPTDDSRRVGSTSARPGQ